MHLTRLPRLRSADPTEGIAGVFVKHLEAITQITKEGYIETTVPGMKEADLLQRLVNRYDLEVAGKDMEEQRDAVGNHLAVCNENAFVSCWHSSYVQTDFMWKLYSGAQYGFCIGTTVSALLDAITDCRFPHEKLGYGFVHYPASRDTIAELLDREDYDSTALMIKDLAFAPEREFRLFVRRATIEDDYVRLPLNLAAMRATIALSPVFEPWASSPLQSVIAHLVERRGIGGSWRLIGL